MITWMCINCSISPNKNEASNLQNTSKLQWNNLPEISEQTRENMKTVILALVVLLVVSQGEALTCYCGGRKQCSESTETCTGSNEVCAIIVSQHDYSYFQSCLDGSDCRRLIQSSDAFGVCCVTDLCN
ncbi:three-finger toxin A2-like isoform X2 [Epinephelus lanceolatus]